MPWPLPARSWKFSFELLPTFDAPHYSIVMGPYTEDEAQRLLQAFGDVLANPYCIRSQR